MDEPEERDELLEERPMDEPEERDEPPEERPTDEPEERDEPPEERALEPRESRSPGAASRGGASSTVARARSGRNTYLTDLTGFERMGYLDGTGGGPGSGYLTANPVPPVTCR